MSDSDARITEIERKLDRDSGVQLAMFTAVKLLGSAHKGNPQAIAAMTSELEHIRALLLSSDGTESKLAGFETAAESLLEALS